MVCCLWRLALLGLAFAGPVLSLPRDGIEADAFRLRSAAAELERRQATSTSFTVVTQLFTRISGSTVPYTPSSTAASSTTSASSSASPTSQSSSNSPTSASASSTASSGPANTNSPSPSPVPAPDNGGGGISPGAIAGIVVGVVAAVAIAAIAGYCIAKRRKKNKIAAGTNPHPTENHYTAGPPAKSEVPYAGPAGTGTTTTATASPNAYNSYTEGYHPNPLNVHNPQTMSELPAESSAARTTQQQFAQPQPRFAAEQGPSTPDGRHELS